MLNIKGLYFLVPLFGKNKFEAKIVNDLECPCYKIVGSTKYFANEEKEILIVMKNRLVSVFIPENQLHFEKEIREKMQSKV